MGLGCLSKQTVDLEKQVTRLQFRWQLLDGTVVVYSSHSWEDIEKTAVDSGLEFLRNLRDQGLHLHIDTRRFEISDKLL